jgi:hypothetical protein
MILERQEQMTLDMPCSLVIWLRSLGVVLSIPWLCLPRAIEGPTRSGGNMFLRFQKSTAVVVAYVVLASAFIVGAELLVVVLL